MVDSHYNDPRKNTVDAQGVVNGTLVYSPLDLSAATSVDDAVAQLVNGANDGLSAKVDAKLVPQVTVRPGGLVEVTLVSFGKGDDSELLEGPRSIVPIYEVTAGSTGNGSAALAVEDHPCLANADYFELRQQTSGLEGPAETLGQVLGLEQPDDYVVKAQILWYAPEGAVEELERRFSSKVNLYVNQIAVSEQPQDGSNSRHVAREGVRNA